MNSNPLSHSLGKVEYGFIVGLAVVQALLLYFLIHGIRQEWWWLHNHMGSVPWLTIVLVVPTVLMLSVQRLRSKQFLMAGLAVLLSYGLIALSAGYLATAPIMLPAAPVLTPFALIMALCAFITAPFLQLQLSPKAVRETFDQRYTILFTNAWHNAITLLIALIFVGLGWALISLWSALFELISIDFFHRIFFSEPMTYALTGLFVGLGILISRSQSKPIQTTRKIIFALFTGLLPVLSLVILLFLVSIPFGSFANLWNPEGQRYVSVAALLGTLIAAQILFFNAVYQRGENGLRVYPRLLRWLVRVAMLALPIYAAIALAAVWVRLANYGFTPARYWALLALLILALHCIGYAWSALRKGDDGVSLIPRVNVAMAGVILGLAFISHLPGVNPYSLSANGQVKVLAQQLQQLTDEQVKISAEHYDSELYQQQVALRDLLQWLRFEVGRPGITALQGLAANNLSPNKQQLVDAELAKVGQYSWQQSSSDAQLSTAGLLEKVGFPASQAPMPEPLAALVLEDLTGLFRCFDDDITCLGSEAPVHEAYPGYTLCAYRSLNNVVACRVYVADGAEDNLWRQVAFFSSTNVVPIVTAMEQGVIIAEPVCWPQLNFGGYREVLTDTSCAANREKP